MRISDWSSDVCSSDLLDDPRVGGSDPRAGKGLGPTIGYAIGSREPEAAAAEPEPGDDLEPGVRATERELPEHIEAADPEQIGTASARERVCRYGTLSVVAVSLKKKHRVSP